jgi:hypothetical protein
MQAHRKRRLRRKFQVFYARHHRTFWTLHSLWALATGVVVVMASRESYGFAAWVMAFLGLTWLSTLFFSRVARRLPDSAKARMGQVFASYLTRVMYQESLFFLLPFYFTSATWPSLNMLFVLLLAALACLACLDLVFDRLLRRHRAFGLIFFATVAFAALNFLLPVLFGLRPEIATPLSAAAGLAAALPLVYHMRDLRRLRSIVEIGAAAALLALILWLGRAVLPPVPLRLDELTFAADVDRDSVEPVRPLESPVSIAESSLGRLAGVARIFAPRAVPARVLMVWRRDGETIHTSREAEITPHAQGFRVWDAVRLDGGLPPGAYTVEVRTVNGQLIGRGSLRLED